jgi:anti-anti-sigma factor
MDRYYHFYDHEGIGVFELSYDKLNIFNTTEIVTQFKDVIEKNNQSTYIIDLKNISHIDSVGIGILIAFKNAVERKGCQLYLICQSDLVYRVLKITKLEAYFTIYRSFDEAVQIIKEKEKDQ